jgi:hypothetical protein
MFSAKRLGVVILSIGLCTLVPVTAAEATVTCNRHMWVKSTVLSNNIGFPDTTVAEVREQDGWKTSGPSNCWGDGLYGFRHDGDKPDSRCYVNKTEGNFRGMSNCVYGWSHDSWYYDGVRWRYWNFTSTIHAYYTWDNPDPYCGRYASCGGAYTLYGRFNIRADSTHSKRCWFKGTLAADEYLHCAGGQILGGIE